MAVTFRRSAPAPVGAAGLWGVGRAWFGVGAFHRRTGRMVAVGEGPLGRGDLAGGPGTAAVERHRLTGRGQVVRPGDRQQLRLILAQVCLPEEGIALDDAPLAGRLPA